MAGEKGSPSKKRTSSIAENNLISLLKQYFKYAGAVIFTWGMGYCDFSVSWLLLALVLYVWKQKYHRDRKREVAAAQSCCKDERAAILARVDDLPSWVFFPDVERAEWLNKMIDQMWPYIGDYVQKMLVDTVEPKIRESLPGSLQSFKFSKIDLGDIPPRIGGVKVYTDQVRRDEIIMDLNITYASDADMAVNIKGINAGVKDFQLRGTVRVVFKPLIGVVPIIGGLSIFFINNPFIDFNLTSLANAFDIPGLNDMLQTIVQEQIANFLVLPNSIKVPLAPPGVDLSRLRYPMPAGVVRVYLLEGKDLKKADLGLTGKGKSDPYCVAKVGAKKYKTKVINDSVAPQWNECFEAIMDVADGQFLELEVKDEDPGSKDDPLGDVNIDLAPVHEKGTMDSWIPLENIKKGLIHVKLVWHYLAKDPLELEKVVRQMKASKESDDFSSCILLINLDSARGLPFVEQTNIFRRGKKNMAEPNPCVTLSVSQTKFESTIKNATNEPKWEENFRFLIHDPHFQDVDVTVTDKKSGKELGEVSIPLKTLLTATDMTLDQRFQLKKALPESQISMRLSLRVLTKEKQLEIREEDEEEEDEVPSSSVDPSPVASETSSTTKPASTSSTKPSASTTKPAETVTARGADAGAKPKVTEEGIQPIRSPAVSHESDLRQRKTATPSANVRGEFGKGRIQMTFRYSTQRKTLIIVIHKCSNLLGLDSNNLSDPYVKLYLLPERSRSSKRKTDVKKDNLNPVFDETFEYSVSPQDLESKTLEVNVKNENSMFSSSKDTMGKVLVDLSSMDISKAITEWFDIAPEDHETKVSIATETDV